MYIFFLPPVLNVHNRLIYDMPLTWLNDTVRADMESAHPKRAGTRGQSALHAAPWIKATHNLQLPPLNRLGGAKKKKTTRITTLMVGSFQSISSLEANMYMYCVYIMIRWNNSTWETTHLPYPFVLLFSCCCCCFAFLFMHSGCCQRIYIPYLF